MNIMEQAVDSYRKIYAENQKRISKCENDVIRIFKAKYLPIYREFFNSLPMAVQRNQAKPSGRISINSNAVYIDFTITIPFSVLTSPETFKDWLYKS